MTTTAIIDALLFGRETTDHATNYTRALCRGLASSNFDDAYQFSGQSMEPSLIFELAQQTKIPESQLQALTYPMSGPLATVRWLVENVASTTDIQRVNLAFCLASFVRYDLAWEVLGKVREERLRPRERYLYQVARFMVANRRGATSNHEASFAKIRDYITAGLVSDARALSAAAFAIVWHDKEQSISTSLHGWFVEQGLELAKRHTNSTQFSTQLALSSFYRAYAMIPARRRDVAATRAAMCAAEQYARAATPTNPLMEVFATDAIKTVLESSLKEHLYIAKDLEAAERCGRELVTLDPSWSISYHELAEVLIHAGRHAEALDLYRHALTIGLPRRAFSQYMVGQMLEHLAHDEQALAAYRATLELDDTNLSAGVCGHNLAKRLAHPSLAEFSHVLQTWELAGHIPNHVKEMIQ
jgi:tetratricopeptide (TPR) repeat protein